MILISCSAVFLSASDWGIYGGFPIYVRRYLTENYKMYNYLTIYISNN